ncbi:MAG: hypothetical protein GY696_12335 [Gammaproteobacteria bacterium]|nr:hypothetical protein [Gammaproteobacteria bacterium]
MNKSSTVQASWGGGGKIRVAAVCSSFAAFVGVQELGQDIQRRKVLCGRLTGAKLKRRPATDATDGFMTMARSETAQAGVIG